MMISRSVSWGSIETVGSNSTPALELASFLAGFLGARRGRRLEHRHDVGPEHLRTARPRASPSDQAGRGGGRQRPADWGEDPRRSAQVGPPVVTLQQDIRVRARRWSASSAPEHGESFRAHAAETAHEEAARRRAVRTVAGRALDASDCRLLLSVLGLDAVKRPERD